MAGMRKPESTFMVSRFHASNNTGKQEVLWQWPQGTFAWKYIPKG